MDRAKFFAEIRATKLFGTTLSTSEVAGMEAIITAFEKAGMSDPRWLAYMLATAFHETAATMQPVRETLAPSDALAAGRLESAWKTGKLPWVKTPYWRKDANGQYWLGRGLVQLTHKYNYEKMSEETGIDLVSNPAKAMDMNIATQIMMIGMVKGSFTGKKLSDYIHDGATDYVNARRIINGMDKASLIAGYAAKFEAALRSGGTISPSFPPPPDIAAPKPEADKPANPPATETEAAPSLVDACLNFLSVLFGLFRK